MAEGQYGLWLYRSGFELHSDGRKRWSFEGRTWWCSCRRRGGRGRGAIRAWSWQSAQRLKFKTVNADVFFKCIITLTYRARTEEWETDLERSKRVVERSRDDRHRLLRCLRKETGEYVWVREFQKRDVLHHHVLCENEISQERATEVWCRASNQLHDNEVLKQCFKVDVTQRQDGVRSCLRKYLGKEKQEDLPMGVEGAGRWWGSSQTLPLAFVDEVIWLAKANGIRRENRLLMVRVLRRFVLKRIGRRFRGAR